MKTIVNRLTCEVGQRYLGREKLNDHMWSLISQATIVQAPEAATVRGALLGERLHQRNWQASTHSPKAGTSFWKALRGRVVSASLHDKI